jgi:hypothetical protein
MFPSAIDVKDGEGNALVTSYAVRRPDGNWSIMLVNRDEKNAHEIQMVFSDSKSKHKYFSGPVRLATFGSEQYVWINDGLNSHADPDGPPIASVLPGGSQATFTLPKASVTVLRGKVEGLSE